MGALELFKAGKLEAAISALNSQLRDNPAGERNRTFLFELLCFSGDYDRAEKQLGILEREGKRESALGTLLYRSAIQAERTRQEMFERKTYPHPILNGVAPHARGSFNGKEFLTISDADPRIGGKLEVYAAGDYLWIAFDNIVSLHVQAPTRLRDLLWMPAMLKTGGNIRSRDLGEVMIPVIAPLSWQHPDEQVRLGRISEWCEDETGAVAPYGMKSILVDGEEIAITELRELEIDSAHAVSNRR